MPKNHFFQCHVLHSTWKPFKSRHWQRGLIYAIRVLWMGRESVLWTRFSKVILGNSNCRFSRECIRKLSILMGLLHIPPIKSSKVCASSLLYMVLIGYGALRTWLVLKFSDEWPPSTGLNWAEWSRMAFQQGGAPHEKKFRFLIRQMNQIGVRFISAIASINNDNSPLLANAEIIIHHWMGKMGPPDQPPGPPQIHLWLSW